VIQGKEIMDRPSDGIDRRVVGDSLPVALRLRRILRR
jgi:hypothetical protein